MSRLVSLHSSGGQGRGGAESQGRCSISAGMPTPRQAPHYGHTRVRGVLSGWPSGRGRSCDRSGRKLLGLDRRRVAEPPLLAMATSQRCGEYRSPATMAWARAGGAYPEDRPVRRSVRGGDPATIGVAGSDHRWGGPLGVGRPFREIQPSRPAGRGRRRAASALLRRRL